jgi:RimJ/RimL family protein N-acetyltransferase
MPTASTELLKQYWFGEIGVSEDDFKDTSIAVTAHGTSLIGYKGAIAFKHQDSWVLSVPSQMLDDIKMRVEELSTETLFNLKGLSDFFGASVDRIIGPAWIGQIESKDFIPCHSDKVRSLMKSDWSVFEKFLAQNDKIEIEHSSLVSGREPTVGVFCDGNIAAAASYELLEGAVAHIGVLVSKEHRGKGFGKEAVSLITKLALESKFGIQYQTLKENKSSVSAAQALGFNEFAETFAVRFKSSVT